MRSRSISDGNGAFQPEFDPAKYRAELKGLNLTEEQKTIILIDDVSRLARDLQAHFELRAAITSVGARLGSSSIEFGEDSDSILVENLLASVSQHQRQKNGEQTKNRMKARVQNGYWFCQAPVGYKYQRVHGRGQMLKRDEPVASVVQEALEGYANGRFETQADVMRFLQDNPSSSKTKAGSCVISACQSFSINAVMPDMWQQPRGALKCARDNTSRSSQCKPINASKIV